MPQTRKVLAKAARTIIESRYGQNPYSITEHAAIERGNSFDCEQVDYWDEEGEGLKSREWLEENAPEFEHCGACSYEYALWERIIEEVGDVNYADRVFNAFALEVDMEELKVELGSVSARELDDLRIVRSERRKFEEYLSWERTEEMKKNAPKATG